MGPLLVVRGSFEAGRFQRATIRVLRPAGGPFRTRGCFRTTIVSFKNFSGVLDRRNGTSQSFGASFRKPERSPGTCI